MKNIFFIAITGLVNFIEHIRGPRKLIPIDSEEDNILTVEFPLDNGSIITIKCEEKKYKLVFQKKWIFDEKISMYKVTSMTTENNDGLLVKLFHKREIYINNLWHFYAGSDILKKAAIRAFMDLIEHDFKAN